jgi:membrane dipeptidase
MNAFRTVSLALLVCLAAHSCSPAPDEAAAPPSETELVELARGIHDRVITLDTHCDIRLSNFTAERNYTTDLRSQVNLPKMEAGGLDVAWFIVFAFQREHEEEGYAAAYEDAKEKFAAIHRLTDEYAPDRIELALTSDDVRRIHAAGKKVAMIGIENGYAVGLEPARVKEFYDLGGRYMSLAHNGHSQLADSNTGEEEGWLHGGLSEIGRQVVHEMNRWGMMIDLSHPSKEANLQAMALSQAPVIASHSAARALSDHSRNLDDEELMALKEGGGVIQAVAFRQYVNTVKHEAHSKVVRALREEVAAEIGFELLGYPQLRELGQEERETYWEGLQTVRAAMADRQAELEKEVPPVDLADYVDHIDYLVDTIGLKHVGISSDFDGGGGVAGWNDASKTFNVTLELVRRGYTEEEIGLLWSGNLLRVLDEVQAVAARIQAEETASFG